MLDMIWIFFSLFCGLTVIYPREFFRVNLRRVVFCCCSTERSVDIWEAHLIQHVVQVQNFHIDFLAAWSIYCWKWNTEVPNYYLLLFISIFCVFPSVYSTIIKVFIYEATKNFLSYATKHTVTWNHFIWTYISDLFPQWRSVTTNHNISVPYNDKHLLVHVVLILLGLADIGWTL